MRGKVGKQRESSANIDCLEERIMSLRIKGIIIAMTAGIFLMGKIMVVANCRVRYNISRREQFLGIRDNTVRQMACSGKPPFLHYRVSKSLEVLLLGHSSNDGCHF